MIDYFMICTRCKIQKHARSGDTSTMESTLPAEFCERHFKKGCSFKDIYFYGDQSTFSDDLDIENYTDDKSKYDDDFWE